MYSVITTSSAQHGPQAENVPGQACIAEALKAAPVSTRLLSRRDPRVASMRSLPTQHWFSPQAGQSTIRRRSIVRIVTTSILCVQSMQATAAQSDPAMLVLDRLTGNLS